MARGGQPAFVLLIILTALVFAVMLVFNAMAGNPAISRGLFKHGIGNVSAMYRIELTPAGWTFSIWGVIYFLQAGWIVYSLSNICRSVRGSPAYTSPAVLSPGFFLVFIVNNVSNIVWLFVWDREYIVAAVPILAATAVACIAGLLIGYKGLATYKEELEREGRHAEISVIRVFVLNGLGLYGSWTTIATILNLGSALAYKANPPLSQESTALVCLGLLVAAYVTFVVLDLTVLESYSRYTFSPYVLLLWALAGVMSQNWNPESTSSIATAVVAGLGIVGLVLKVVVTYWRQSQPNGYKKLKIWSTPGNDVYPILSSK